MMPPLPMRVAATWRSIRSSTSPTAWWWAWTTRACVPASASPTAARRGRCRCLNLRENGCHALRHFYASTALHEGETIKAVSEYLGHADPGFTLRTYTHLMEGSSEPTKRAIDAAFLGRPDAKDEPDEGKEDGENPE